jgi:outer membrane receptor for ferrienterochelin and colicin
MIGLACVLIALLIPRVSIAQVTTGSIRGVVIDTQKRPVSGAIVVAIHIPSGTNYEGTTRADGRFEIPNVRVGGPYSVVVSPATGAPGGLAFKATTQDNVMVNLGAATDLTFDVQPMVSESVEVVAQSDTVFNSQRTGAATTVTRDQLATLPTISGRLTDITRLTPQSGGTLTFAGADPRLNNITVDGSYFNNSFGIRNSPGDTSGVAPISLSAIEQVQVNIAPYDVRQGNFTGAAVNTVTRSGGNTFHGSFSHASRNQNWVGTTARGLAFNPGTFEFRNDSLWGSGPIKPNKAFFFVNYDNEAFTQPGTTFRANLGGETAAGSVTRVLASDLDDLSAFMKQNFNYDTGPYQDYNFNTPAVRFLVKSDINLNDHNKLAIRYNHLDSNTDVLTSNSSSVGFGTRRGNTNSLNFANSNYIQLENIRSLVGEVNSIIGTNMANNLIVGYTAQNENREYTTPTIFPMVDILSNSLVYTTMGFEPFTPKNQLKYNTFQVQNNFQEFAKDHTLTFGVSFERYNSRNVFFPASQSAYVYNSLADFKTDAMDYLANKDRTTSPVTLRRFDLRWNNIPDQDEPVQLLHVTYLSGYVQDDWRIKDRLTLNIGLRWDAPFFGDTGYANANADALTFRDEAGDDVQYKTGKLPGSNPLWSPRVGFNWDVNGKQDMQVRGGTGIFSGKPAYVWISNQVGNTGMLTGTERLDNTTLRPFHPDPNHYKPASVNGSPAPSYNLELINGDFKFPQIWRTNIAVDRKLPWGLTGTFEAIFNQDVNGLYYINANLPAAQSQFTGADQRKRWTGASCNAPTVGPCSNRINNATGNVVSTAVVLKNQNVGHGWDIATVLEKRLSKGLWVKGAYHYGEARNTIDPGSIATGSWTANQISNDPNNPGLSFASNSPAHRFFVVGSYNHDFFSFGTTTVSMFWDSHTNGSTHYTFPTDANGDGGTSNDLIYIARDTSEMYFQQYTSVTGVTYTPAVQAAAWEAYIKQDPYLREHRGDYVVRNAIFLPLVHRLDFSASQDVRVKVGNTTHGVQFRVDIENFTNLLSSNWGVGQRLVNTQPLTDPTADAQGRLQYRLREVNGALMDHTYERTSGLTDVYRIMFSIRYSF